MEQFVTYVPFLVVSMCLVILCYNPSRFIISIDCTKKDRKINELCNKQVCDEQE